MLAAKKYDLLCKNPQSTVVGEYVRKNGGASGYQSEAALERAFIEELQNQGYEYIKYHVGGRDDWESPPAIGEAQ